MSGLPSSQIRYTIKVSNVVLWWFLSEQVKYGVADQEAVCARIAQHTTTGDQII